jgi:hypothetical protein
MRAGESTQEANAVQSSCDRSGAAAQGQYQSSIRLLHQRRRNCEITRVEIRGGIAFERDRFQQRAIDQNIELTLPAMAVLGRPASAKRSQYGSLRG